MKTKAQFLISLLLLFACQESAVPGVSPDPQTPKPKVDQPLPSVLIERAWFPVPEVTAVVPNAGYRLLAVQLTGKNREPTTLKVPETVLVDSSGQISIPVGAAAFSSSSFRPFGGFVSGWRAISDAAGSEVKIGRDKAEEPISMVLTGETAKLIVLYIVPEQETSFHLKIGDSRPMPVELSPPK
jgi:hypothetical protein